MLSGQNYVLPMKTAYSYVRLSSKQQTTEDRTGEIRQLSRATEICKQNGWQLSPKTFKDLGVSGWEGKNRLQGDLGNFIKLAKDGKLAVEPVLIIEDFSRFSRQDIDASEPAILDLLGTGVDIHVAFSNKTFTKSSAKDLVSRIEILVCLKAAYDFSANLSRRVKAARKITIGRINKGEIIKYTNTPRYYTWNPDTKRFDQNWASGIVKRIIKEFLEGSSLYKISNGLNDDKTKTIGYKKCRGWTTMTVRGILMNKAIYGAYHENDHYYTDPIVDKDTFDNIQVILKRNKYQKGRFGTAFINIFRGLARCPYCGGAMIYSADLYNRITKKPKRVPYRFIRCCSVSNGRKCKNKFALNLVTIEDEFFGVFLKQDPITLFPDPADKKTDGEIARLNRDLQKISDRIFKLLSLKDMELPELQSTLDELKAEKELVMKQIQERTFGRTEAAVNKATAINFKNLYEEIAGDEITVEGADAFAKGIGQLRERLKDNELRTKLRLMLPSLISKIEVDSIKGEWRVFDLNGKKIYTSMPM